MTIAKPIKPVPSSEIVAEVEKRTGQKVIRCNQCAKCSGGCPAAFAMDLMPRQVMRALQLGLKDEVLGSSTIWVCLQCETCSIRCPREIDIARVMEGLRYIALDEKSALGEPGVAQFHQIFVRLVGWFGRMYELGLAGGTNMVRRRPFDNIDLLPALLGRDKLPLLPPLAKGGSRMRQIMKRVREIEAEEQTEAPVVERH